MVFSFKNNCLCAVFAGVLVSIASTAAADTLTDTSTIRDYDLATQEERNQFVAEALENIYNYYALEEIDKAVCMDSLYGTINASGTPRLFTIIVNELEDARGDDPDGYRVGDVIFGAIDVECSPQQNETAGIPAETPNPG